MEMEMDIQVPSYWKRLNQPKRVMAPMVAQSDLPFRRLCRNHGTDLCFTQMIHSANFLISKSFQDAHLDVYPLIMGIDTGMGETETNTDTNSDSSVIYLSSSGRNALEGLDWEDWNTRFPQHEALSGLWKDYQENSSPSSIRSGMEIGDTIGDTIGDNIVTSTSWSRYQEGGIDSYSNHNINITPLIVQIAGHEKKTMSDACKIILQRTNNPNAPEGVYQGPVSGIDINCGCPQAIARKGRYGAHLMEESVDIVCEIISTLRQDLPKNVGISCKMRIPQGVGTPEGDEVLKERVCKLIDAGVELITVHGRNIKENKTRVRECDWDAIKKAVAFAREHSGDENFPIISNGGIEYSSDIDRCLEHTGASAVMSSEALLENPAIFEEGGKDDLMLAPKLLFDRQIGMCHEYLDLCILYPPVPGSLGKVGGSFNCIRGHVFKFLYRYMEEHPDIRELLGHNTKVTSIQHTRELLYELEKRYGNVKNWDTLRSSDAIISSWYRRHRNAIAGSKMRIRGAQTAESELVGLSMEDKKIAMKERLKKLKEERASKIFI
jgi:tRNA-dihydrouridine synthase